MKPAEPTPIAEAAEAAEPTPIGKPAEPTTRPLQGWPLDLAGDLPLGCHGWSPTDATVVCVTASGSMQSGNKYLLEFIGSKPATYTLAEQPPLNFDDIPLILGEAARAEVAARLAAGAYVALPDERFGEITPEAPYTGDGFTLRWIRKTIRHVATSVGSWDVIRDTVQIECTGKKAKKTIYTSTLDNPDHGSAFVRILSPNLVLIERDEQWGIEGDIGGGHVANLIALDAAGC
ncbi:hypothetical protein [Nannocystis exedens]|uniref:hypothetical protein n=1 Tax=Nannocystis exedens TaxID=54 RepID=UPI0011609D29|nr:hypothetical protein [Nannocystis exedens]